MEMTERMMVSVVVGGIVGSWPLVVGTALLEMVYTGASHNPAALVLLCAISITAGALVAWTRWKQIQHSSGLLLGNAVVGSLAVGAVWVLYGALHSGESLFGALESVIGIYVFGGPVVAALGFLIALDASGTLAAIRRMSTSPRRVRAEVSVALLLIVHWLVAGSAALALSS